MAPADDDAPRPGNAFSALMDDDSDSEEDAAAGPGPEPAAFFVEGCVARLTCRVTKRRDGGDASHHVLVARIEAASVREDYWAAGKMFCARHGAPPFLTFLGSQKFGHAVPA